MLADWPHVGSGRDSAITRRHNKEGRKPLSPYDGSSNGEIDR